jgi:hypothetical protein
MSYANVLTGQFWTNDTAAHFRAWATVISGAFSSGGMIQTSDTGQINLTTVAAPGAINTAMGYEIWRFADTLQATKPVFIKIEYGSGGTSASNPGIWLTIGTASDGAGNITGTIKARNQIGVNTTNISTATNSVLISVGTGRFSFTFGYNQSATNYFMLVGLERTKDSSDADTSTGLLLVSVVSGTTGTFQVLLFSGSAPSAETNGNSLIPAADATTDGSNVGVFPLKFFNFGAYVRGGMNWKVYRTNEIGTGTFTVTIQGVSHTFYAMGASGAANLITSMAAISRNNNAIAMRYE